MKVKQVIIFVGFAVVFCSCNSKKPLPPIEENPTNPSGVYITCQGQFGIPNGSLSIYDTAEEKVYNQIFYNANSIPVGDVFQSFYIDGEDGYMVVNGSEKIIKMSMSSYDQKGVLGGFSSPRYIQPITETKWYVTNLYASEMYIFNPQTMTKTGNISTGTHPSTNQMLKIGNEVFVSTWSYGDSVILIVDANEDKVKGSIVVGSGANSMVGDKEGNIWVMCEGDWSGNPPASLYVFSPKTQQLINHWALNSYSYGGWLAINTKKDTVFYIEESGIYAMPIISNGLPSTPLFTLPSDVTVTGFAVNSTNGIFYIANGKDYVQNGEVLRYSSSGDFINSFSTGVIPSEFVFD